MSEKLLFLLFTLLFAGFSAENSVAQISRKTVGAAEVNGTFRAYFSGKAKGSYDEIKIFALGKGKLKIGFDLVYPYIDGTGEQSANMGEAEGIAEIVGDTAVYTNEEFGQCKITIKFAKPGTIRVNQKGTDAECGFGHNVSADGTYKKFSGAKPKFEN